MYLGNREGSCEGDLCRLDISFSDRLYKMKKTWKSEYHAHNGFDRSESCKASVSRTGSNGESEKTGSGTGSGTGNGESLTKCCGNGLGRHIYRSDRMECCKDGTSKPIGSC
mgnify:CR=1 FL=1